MTTKEVSTNKPGNEPFPVSSIKPLPVVGIGASAGGLEAFKKLLAAIPDNKGVSFIIMMHLDANHVRLLPELLQRVTTIHVIELTIEIIIEPNLIYIIPSNKLMIANEEGRLELNPRLPKGSAGT